MVGVLARLWMASSSRRWGGVRGWSSRQAMVGLEFSTGWGWVETLDRFLVTLEFSLDLTGLVVGTTQMKM